MKQKPNPRVFLCKYLKKLCVNLKFLVLTVALSVICALSGYGQQELVVTGTVTDASNGSLLPGVNVVIKGTITGALTGLDGKYPELW